jgi:hypothetical protein
MSLDSFVVAAANAAVTKRRREVVEKDQEIEGDSEVNKKARTTYYLFDRTNSFESRERSSTGESVKDLDPAHKRAKTLESQGERSNHPFNLLVTAARRIEQPRSSAASSSSSFPSNHAMPNSYAPPSFDSKRFVYPADGNKRFNMPGSALVQVTPTPSALPHISGRYVPDAPVAQVDGKRKREMSGEMRGDDDHSKRARLMAASHLFQAGGRH